MMKRALEIKTTLILTLLTMILLRLVWMDLRSYVIHYAPENKSTFSLTEMESGCRRSFGLKQWGSERHEALERPSWANALVYRMMISASCRSGVFLESRFVRYNQGLLLCSLILCVLLARILAGSWIVGMALAVALLSRGRLIAANGQISGDALIMFGLSFWVLCLGHWLRSGAWSVYLASFAGIVFLSSLEPPLLALAILPFVLVWSWRFIRAQRGGDLSNSSRPELIQKRDERLWQKLGGLLNLKLDPNPRSALTGGLFRPLAEGIRGLLLKNYFWQSFQLYSGIGLLLSSIAGLILVWGAEDGVFALSLPSWHSLRIWFEFFLRPLDRDLLLALSMMLLGTSFRSRWLPYLRPLIVLVFLCLACHSLSALLYDSFTRNPFSLGYSTPDRLLLLWEPIVMSLGLLALYQLLLSLLGRLDRWNFMQKPKSM